VTQVVPAHPAPSTVLTATPGPASATRGDTTEISGGSLTLEVAEETALKNQPRIAAAELRRQAAQQKIIEGRSSFLPTAVFNATGVRVADPGTSTATGALTTSSISDRFAYGGTITQLVTDFGRTSALVRSARYRLQSQAELVTLNRAQVRLAVRQAYCGVLGAEAVLRAAKQALANRHLITHQITALANSQLRSTLDVNFAGVVESQAELTVVRAQNVVEQQRSRLATAIGQDTTVTSPLADLPLPELNPVDQADLSKRAEANRADLNAARLDQKSTDEVTQAERRLRYPTLQLLGAAGQVPFHDHTLQGNYAAAGFNLNIPVFNGGLYRARESEAALEASARSKDVADLSLRVNQQVRDAMSQLNEALRALDVTQRLVTQSTEALRLAQARYDNGLGSIVELNEAQLNQTSAQINAADARYAYLSRRADLDYVTGLLN
jgi:outer membrane protein